MLLISKLVMYSLWDDGLYDATMFRRHVSIRINIINIYLFEHFLVSTTLEQFRTSMHTIQKKCYRRLNDSIPPTAT